MIAKLLKVAAPVLVACYLLLVPNSAHAARLYFYPDELDVVAGGSFVVEVRLDTEGESVNAVHVKGNVTGGILESVTTANSIIDIFINASVDENRRTFHFYGGTPNGFSGDGIIGRLNITSGRPGEVNITFDEETQILSGEGVDISETATLNTAKIISLEPSANHIIITSRSHPDQNQWYNKSDVNLHWDLEDGVEYSYLVSLDPKAVPDETPDRPTGDLIWQGDISLSGLGEGIYYFTLRRIGQDGVTRYRMMIDKSAPEWIGFEMSDGVAETQYTDFITLFAKDKLSGINRYEVRVDNEEPKIILSPYLLPDDYFTLTFSAIDNAGNKTEKTIVSDSQKAITWIYIISALMALGAIIVLVKPIRKRIFTN